MASVGTGQIPSMFIKGMKAVYDMQLKAAQKNSMIPMLFTRENSKEKDTVVTTIGGTRPTPVFTGSIPSTTVYEQYAKTLSPMEFADGFSLSRLDLATSEIKDLKKKSVKLADGAFKRQESDAMGIFNYAFTADVPPATHTTSYRGGDAFALCYGAHPWKQGGPTQSNLLAGAVSHAKIQEALLLMRNLKDDTGTKLEIEPTHVYCGDANVPAVQVAIGSEGRPGVADNDVNVLRGNINELTARAARRLQIRPVSRITDNRWFLVNETLAKEYCLWLDIISADMYDKFDFETQTQRFAVYMAYKLGFTNYLWIVGSPGA